jgi:hypothetical protein
MNLRDVAVKRLETGEDAETRIVEVLMRAATDIRERLIDNHHLRSCSK